MVYPDISDAAVSGCPCCQERLEAFRDRAKVLAQELDLDEFVFVARRRATCMTFAAGSDEGPLMALCEPMDQLAKLAVARPHGTA